MSNKKKIRRKTKAEQKPAKPEPLEVFRDRLSNLEQAAQQFAAQESELTKELEVVRNRLQAVKGQIGELRNVIQVLEQMSGQVPEPEPETEPDERSNNGDRAHEPQPDMDAD